MPKTGLSSIEKLKQQIALNKKQEADKQEETNAEENPGLAKLPTDVRNKMGYMRKGGKAKKMMSGGTCS